MFKFLVGTAALIFIIFMLSSCVVGCLAVV